MQTARSSMHHQGIAVLLVTSDRGLAETIQQLLTPNGYQVLLADTAHTALLLARRTSSSLALIDRRHQVITLLRSDQLVGHIPMIAIQPLGCSCTEEEFLIDLTNGFDMVLPSHRHRECLAIMKSLLRRQALQRAPMTEFRVHDLYMSVDRYEVTVAGVPVRLTPKQFTILRVLIQDAGRVLSRQDLLNRVWGADIALEEHALDVHIHAIRRKIEPNPSKPALLHTIRGIGYKLHVS